MMDLLLGNVWNRKGGGRKRRDEPAPISVAYAGHSAPDRGLNALCRRAKSIFAAHQVSEIMTQLIASKFCTVGLQVALEDFIVTQRPIWGPALDPIHFNGNLKGILR